MKKNTSGQGERMVLEKQGNLASSRRDDNTKNFHRFANYRKNINSV